MEKVASSYLKELNIPISKSYCEKLIVSHPDYPSMLSVADTLERLGIRYEAARIEKKYLNKVEHPYLLWPGEQNGEPKIVRKQRDLPVHGMQEISHNGSEEQVVVLKVKPTDKIADEENKRQLSRDRFYRILAGVLITGATGIFILNIMPIINNWVYTLLLLTAFAGIAIGYLIIAKDIGISYKPIEDFCNAGKRTNCDAVLRSDGARLFGPVTLSDAVASYFLFQLAALGFLIPLFKAAAPVLGALAGLSALTIPVIGYSLYYQAVKVKTWCRLCLLVDGILIFQVVLFGYLYASGVVSIGDAEPLSMVLMALLFAATGSGIVLVKSVLKRATEAEQAEAAASRIKYAPEVFLHLLSLQKWVDVTSFQQEMVIGDPRVPLTITMAASLGCSPCKTGFEKAAQLVAAFPDEVSLVVRLRTYSGNNGDRVPGDWLLGYWQQHIHGQSDASVRTEQLLQDWYELMDLDQFRKKYPLKSEDGSRTATEMLKDQHAEWLDQAEIKATPTFLVNGWQLPKKYRIEDLMGLAPVLVDHVERQEIRQKTLKTDEEFVPSRTLSGRDKGG